LVEKKGHDDLIRAVAILIKQGLQVSLSIIGEGAARAPLEGLIASLGVGDHVRLLGAQHRERVREELNRAHLFALMSKTARNGNKEGIPTVMMEAQTAGLPVCSTLHSGIPEVIPEPFQRWLAPEGDVESIARGLKDAITRRDLWDEAATRGRRHIQENFSLPTETGKLIRLYQGLLSGDKA
jgi:colanic acid/amylovoran biosynthesis glycosyltransferase